MLLRTAHATSSGGTRLTLRVRGAGPALVLCNGWSTSDFFWKHMLPRWEPRYTVVTWDYPGHGASDPAAAEADVHVEALADDVRLVMDAAGVERATLVGYSMGCQVALEAAARAADRVDAVIPLLGSFEHMIGTAIHPRLGAPIAGVLRRLPGSASWGVHAGLHRIMRGRAGIPLGRWLRMVGPDAADVDVQDYIEHFGRIHAPSLFAMAAAGQRHSARAALGRIRAPVFIVTGRDDALAPPALSGALLHSMLPGSRWVELPRGTHTSLFEHHEQIANLIDGFLRAVGVC